MDLALARSCSIRELEATTTERELLLWQIYDRRRVLPHRRAELHAAQIAHQIAMSRGAKNVSFDDFLFKPRTQDAAKAFAFKPRKRKKKD
jgi:hypothetical protein